MGVDHDLVLVGGGHAHIQVLRAWAMRPLPDVRVTVVVDRPVAVYSGMVPGFVAGQYRRSELEIDVRPLAMRARARFVVAAARGVDPVAQRIELDGRPSLPYDTASWDVGSTVAGSELPGVSAYAVATRPIGRFVRAAEGLIARARGASRFAMAVIGAGAGGVELAFAFAARLRAEGVREPVVTLVEAGDDPLPGAAPRTIRAVRKAAAAREIALRTGARVAAVEVGAVKFEDGDSLATDAVVWVTGAASLSLFGGTLPCDERGFLRVEPTLQVVEHPSLFGVGDCIRFDPDLPKAGVYAVRQGPVLLRNLRARISGRRPRRYHPQRDFLSLLNLGDGSAIATKWGLSAQGANAFRLKDWIDRRFMRRFQVLDETGRRMREFPDMPGMSGEEMPCGGCAAKVGESVLERALRRLEPVDDPRVVMGLGARDDAAAVTSGDGLWVASVDAFRAFTDDPYLVGRVAAVNAASDLWAKGIDPRFALAQVTLDRDDDDARREESLYQVLAGAREALDAEGVTLLGGHTGAGEDLAVGFSLWGEAGGADALLPISALTPGAVLILSKPLGTGVLFHADMRGWARGCWMERAVASMLRPNGDASRIAKRFGARACTDVSGFGLAGHLGEMLRASGVSARLAWGAVPLLPGVSSLLRQGVRSTFHPENARARRGLRIATEVAAQAELDALFDPQTSGGLLFAVAPERAGDTVAALRASGDQDAAAIGWVTEASVDDALFEVVPGSL